MKIKFIELNNFKSFKGKTTIPFKSGLTIITGLNGAGKSNIIDGIILLFVNMKQKPDI